MEGQTIIEILKQRGYDSRSAELVVGDLLQLSNPLDSFFDEWLNDDSNLSDFTAAGYSVLHLMDERKMTYPAALLTMDWVLKDPESALRSLKRGIK